MNEAEQRQTRVRNLEEECSALSGRLDSLIEQFATLAPAAAAAWIREEFARGIRDNAEQFQELGVGGMKVIKNDMEHLIKELPVTCAYVLRDRFAWPHHEEEVPTRPSVHKEFFLDRVFRDLISTAGNVLERHNLLGNRGPHSYWQRVKAGWRYSMNSTTAQVAPDVCEEYMNGLDQLRELKLRYASERKGLAEIRAQTLWDSV